MTKKYICNKAKDKSCNWIKQCTAAYSGPQHGKHHEWRDSCKKGWCNLNDTVVECVEVEK